VELIIARNVPQRLSLPPPPLPDFTSFPSQTAHKPCEHVTLAVFTLAAGQSALDAVKMQLRDELYRLVTAGIWLPYRSLVVSTRLQSITNAVRCC